MDLKRLGSFRKGQSAPFKDGQSVHTNRYIIDSAINEGISATVYKAHSSVTNKVYALKVFNDRNHHYFAREISILHYLRSLKWPQDYRPVRLIEHFIETVYDPDNNVPWTFPVIVLEYLPSTIYDISGDEGMDSNKIQPYAKSLLSLLCRLESEGIIHGDIKPDNIMIDTTYGTVVLIDFGAAIINQERDATYYGTFGYCAPETFEQPACTHYKSDIWSLCITLFEIATHHIVIFSLFDVYNELHKIGGQETDTEESIEEFDDEERDRLTLLHMKKIKDFINEDLLMLATNDEIFARFIISGLKWDLKDRASSNELLKHDYINHQY